MQDVFYRPGSISRLELQGTNRRVRWWDPIVEWFKSLDRDIAKIENSRWPKMRIGDHGNAWLEFPPETVPYRGREKWESRIGPASEDEIRRSSKVGLISEEEIKRYRAEALDEMHRWRQSIKACVARRRGLGYAPVIEHWERDHVAGHVLQMEECYESGPRYTPS